MHRTIQVYGVLGWETRSRGAPDPDLGPDLAGYLMDFVDLVRSGSGQIYHLRIPYGSRSDRILPWIRPDPVVDLVQNTLYFTRLKNSALSTICKKNDRFKK